MNICFSLLTNSENSLIFSVITVTLRKWDLCVSSCLLTMKFLCAKLVTKCHFTKGIWKGEHLYISAQMFTDRKRGMSWIGLERLLCFSLEALEQRATLTGLSALNWLLYHMYSVISNAYINKSFFVAESFVVVCLFHKCEWKLNLCILVLYLNVTYLRKQLIFKISMIGYALVFTYFW